MKAKLNIDQVEQLLVDNGFIRLSADTNDWQSDVTNPRTYDITWGHSEIRCYIRENEIYHSKEQINVQYQHLYNVDEITEDNPQDAVWSVIFDELPLFEGIIGYDGKNELTHKFSFIEARKSLSTYSGFDDLNGFIELCFFTRGIDIMPKLETNKVGPGINGRCMCCRSWEATIMDNADIWHGKCNWIGHGFVSEESFFCRSYCRKNEK